MRRPIPLAPFRYHDRMSNENKHDELPEELERYLALCQRIYERMVETGKWPWSDSPDFDVVVESEDNPNDP